MFSILPAGLGRCHRGNPAASLQAHQIYGTPVLLSGLTTLNLKYSETQLVSQHVKATLQNLQKFLPRTPSCVVRFLGGHLPGEALLNIRQLSIFGMICRLPGSILYQIADHLLSSAKPASKSWFLNIRELCLKYDLPSPLSLLHQPPTKLRYKALVKSKVMDYWEKYLRNQALKLSSLQYFKA